MVYHFNCYYNFLPFLHIIIIVIIIVKMLNNIFVIICNTIIIIITIFVIIIIIVNNTRGVFLSLHIIRVLIGQITVSPLMTIGNNKRYAERLHYVL